MRHFWQWLSGYICVCIKGRQINRFLNLCSRNGIHLWRIRYHMEQEIYANLKFRDFYDLKPYLRKTKTRLKVISKKGFPFWCHRHPRLKWFMCVCFILLCIAAYSTCFVWNIQIKGNTQVPTEKILECLKQNNINVGQKKAGVDCSGIEILLRKQFQQLGWVSAYFENTNLCIEVKESLYDVMDNELLEHGKRYDFVANKDAQIVSIVTRSGKAIVEKSQRVKKGDVLVLGFNEIYDDTGEIKEIILLKADALVYGDVVYEFIVPLTEIEIVSMKLAKSFDESSLLHLGYQKSIVLEEKLKQSDVTILDKEIIIQKEDKKINFLVTIYAREQIGVNIPVEEVLENEFK